MNHPHRTFSYETLPVEAQKHIITQYVIQNNEQHREKILEKTMKNKTNDLFDLTENTMMEFSEAYEDNVVETPIIWATNNYTERGEGYQFNDPITEVEIIRPRTEKSLEEQRKRVKEKAEVFTPSWVCNLQNNLIDDSLLGEHSFNMPSKDKKSWISTPKVQFSEDKPWWRYVAERRLEMCCGEGPYLFSRYDTTTGVPIPVRNIKATEDDEIEGDWRRIGVLDRKLRVVTENSEDLQTWIYAAQAALRSTYGYEWQGDNLYLARMNMLNTFFDYLDDYLQHGSTGRVNNDESKHNNTESISSMEDDELISLLITVAEIISKQLWQMDGLKMVLPESCSSTCVACVKKQRVWHDGVKPVFTWGKGWRSFEEMYVMNEPG